MIKLFEMKKSLFYRILKNASSPLYRTADTVKRIILLVLLFACIAAVITVAVTIFARPAPRLGIIAASIGTGALSFALALVSLPLLRKVSRYDEMQIAEQLAEQKAEIARLKIENAAHVQKETDYEQRVKLLENLTMNIETYSDVFKICFRDYQQASTVKQREIFNEDEHTGTLDRILNRSAKNYDEILSVIDCMVSYQRGVDIQNIRIAKVNSNTVVVSGIQGEYLAKPRFDYKTFLSELRHVKLDKNDEVKEIAVETSSYGRHLLQKKENEYKAKFEDSFLNGKKDKDSEEMVKRAEDFIKIILQPVFAHVEFDRNVLVQGSVPLLEFLHSETELCKAMLENKSRAQ